jgi:hypothetical protein
MKVVLFCGQSLAVEFFSLVGPTPLTPHSDTHMWSGSGWVPPTGDGAVMYCNCLRSALNESIYIVNVSVGGMALLPINGSTCWTDPASGSVVNTAIAQTQAALASLPLGTILDRVEFWGCQSDAMAQAYPSLCPSIKTGLGTLEGLLRAGLGSDFRFCVWPVGKVPIGYTMDTLRGQIEYVDEHVTTAELGPATYDLSYRPGEAHLVAGAYPNAAIRAARNALSYFQAKANNALTIPHYGSGPRIRSIARDSSYPTSLLIGFDVKNGFCLQPVNRWTGDSYVGSFGVWRASDDAWLTFYTTRLMGGWVRLDGPTTFSSPVRIGYEWERGCTTWSPVYDSNDQFYPGWGQPLLPYVPAMMVSN